MSDLRIIIMAVAALVLLLAATAQAALVYIDRARLRHMLEEGTPRANALMRLLDAPSSSLSTILFIYTVALAAAAASGFSVVLDVWAWNAWAGAGLAIALLIVLLLVQFMGRVFAVSAPESV